MTLIINTLGWIFFVVICSFTLLYVFDFLINKLNKLNKVVNKWIGWDTLAETGEFFRWLHKEDPVMWEKCFKGFITPHISVYYVAIKLKYWKE